MGDLCYYLSREAFLLLPRLVSRRHHLGLEHFPKSGGALVLCNHISHLDPPLLAAKCPRPIHYMADKPLLEIPLLGRALRGSHAFPIDRTKSDRAALREALARLEAGHLVGIFPERGIRHGPESVLGGAEMHPGTASLWKMARVPVIPAVLIGSDQLYAVRDWWRRPRIFLGAGRPLLPDENASREELRDRIVAAWREIFAALQRTYAIRPEELPRSAQERWGQALAVPKAFRPPVQPRPDSTPALPAETAAQSASRQENGED